MTVHFAETMFRWLMRAYPARFPLDEGRGGTVTSGSHVHGCSVVGLGIRLYPCGIVIGYAVDLHRDLPARTDETQTRSSTPSQLPRWVCAASQPTSTGFELVQNEEA